MRRALEGIPFGVAVSVAGDRVAGYAQDRAVHGFVWSGGATQTLPLPADRLSIVNATNDSSAMVGTYHAPNNESHAFVVSEGALTDLGTLGGSGSAALAINSRGDLCGSSELADGGTHGFVARSGSSLVDIGVPFGGTSSDARGIDTTGRVAANARIGPVSRPFVYLAHLTPDAGETDLLPKTDAGKRYASAHVAAMASNGRIAGWAIAPTESKSQVSCVVWMFDGMTGTHSVAESASRNSSES